MKKQITILCLLASGFLIPVFAADPELANYRSGISVIPGAVDGSDKGSAYYEEYFYFDKPVFDAKVIYLRSDTPLTMGHSSLNKAFYHVSDGGNQYIGVNGKDGIPNSGDEGVIRYKLDRDRQDYLIWSDNTARTTTSRVLPAYTAPFTLADLQYGYDAPGVPVVGTTGGNGGTITSKTSYFYRGIQDTVNVTGAGDEYHVLSYADDDNEFLRLTPNFVDQKFYASDAKTVLLCVNPKTPCFTARVTGTGQFYTTPLKAYWTPKIVAQTTYIYPGTSGTVTIELRDIYGNNVHYRINGGSYTDAGASTVTIPDSAFSSGFNTLEYYYTGNEAFVKTRTVVKNPTHPSLAEPHGNYLWVDSTGYSTVLNRLTRAPYLSWYNLYKSGGDVSAQTSFEALVGTGKKEGGGAPLINAFVAKVNGFSYTAPGAARSYGEYAKMMTIYNSRVADPVGFEVQMSAGASGNRELHAFGYNDANPVIQTLFAYDILVGNYRSDQVAGGVTPIEDYFIRDTLANFAYEAMQWSAGMTGLGDPGMWGGSRMLVSTCIAIILKEYSTEYYGTSGFGAVQDSFPLCPYQDDQLTWKEALFDGTAMKSAYPNMTWYTGLSDNGAFSVFLDEGQTVGSYTYQLGDFLPKNAYFSFGLMGRHLCTWANMVKLWAGGHTDARLEAAIIKATTGNLRGAGDAKSKQATGLISNASPGVVTWASHGQPAGKAIAFKGSDLPDEITAGTTYYISSTNLTANSFEIAATLGGPSINTSGGSGYQEVSTVPPGGRFHMLTLLNERWPAAVANNLSWVQSLPGSDPNSDDKAMQDAAVFGFAWYDDGGGAPPPDTTAPSVAITGPTTSPTYATTDSVIPTLSGVASDDTSVAYVTWSSDRGGSGTASGTSTWTVTPLTLQPGVNVITVRAYDGAGNASVADTITITYTIPVDPPSGDLTTHTNPRNRALLGR